MTLVMIFSVVRINEDENRIGFVQCKMCTYNTNKWTASPHVPCIYIDIGHLGGTSNHKWFGIHLIESIEGGSNGILHGMQLFTSSQGHATYVKREDILDTLDTTQLITEMQLIINTYSKRLDQYVFALEERDVYIETLKKQIKSQSNGNFNSSSSSSEGIFHALYKYTAIFQTIKNSKTFHHVQNV